MSGIVGIVGAFNQENILNMSRAIAHRGADSTAYWHDSNCAFGQLLLKNNTCQETEKLPIFQDEIAIIADARIDSSETNLLNLYRQDGIAMTQALIGDFAIAIWDKTKQQLLLIRDHSGVRPLFYVHKKGEFFAFASEPKALLALEGVTKTLNEEKIGVYLQWQNDFRAFQNDTFYKEIQAVLPATSLLYDVASDSFTEDFYWKPNLDRFLNLKTDQDFAEAFRFYFTQAIQRRSESGYRIGAHLSGGLDSSSVCVVARDILSKKNEKLITVHFDSENSLTDEKPYAQKVLDTGGFEHQWIRKTEFFMEDLEKCQTIIDKPDTFTVPLGLFRINESEYLQQNGVRTLLTGHDGDTVVDSARFFLEDLIKNKQIKEFKHLWAINLSYKDHTTQYKDWQSWNPLQRVKALAPKKLKQIVSGCLKQHQWKDAFLMIALFIKEGLISPFAFLKITSDWAMKEVSKLKKDAIKTSVINGAFQQRINLKSYAQKQQKFRFLPSNLSGEKLEHFKRIHCAGIIEINETFNFLGAKYGLDVCHPFLDKDLIELCIATPPHLRYFDGKGRGQMRMAMVGLLPDDVLKRTSKIEFSPVIRDNLLAIKPSIFQKINEAGFNNYINSESILDLEKGLIKTEYQSLSYSKYLQRALFLSEWLKTNQNEPIAANLG